MGRLPTLEADTFKVVFLILVPMMLLDIVKFLFSDTIIKKSHNRRISFGRNLINDLNDNLCSPDDAIIFLTDDTFNPDTTSYLICVY